MELSQSSLYGERTAVQLLLDSWGHSVCESCTTH